MDGCEGNQYLFQFGKRTRFFMVFFFIIVINGPTGRGRILRGRDRGREEFKVRLVNKVND